MPSMIDTVIESTPPEPWFPLSVWQKGGECVVVIDADKFKALPADEHYEVFNWVVTIMQTFKSLKVKAWVDTR